MKIPTDQAANILNDNGHCLIGFVEWAGVFGQDEVDIDMVMKYIDTHVPEGPIEKYYNEDE